MPTRLARPTGRTPRRDVGLDEIQERQRRDDERYMELDGRRRVLDIDEAVDRYERKHKRITEELYDRYRDHMDLLDKSLLSKVRKATGHGGIGLYDYFALGKQLDQFEEYVALMEEEGNVNMLGQIPRIAFDVVTVAYGASIIPVLASVQPIEEENGTVYFRDVRFGDTKGAQTADTNMLDPRSPLITPRSYASNYITGEVGATMTNGTAGYNFTLANLPVRQGSVRITAVGQTQIQSTTPYAIDQVNNDGQTGQLIGLGMTGTINYITGAVSITMTGTVVTGATLQAAYQQNYETASEIPLVTQFMASQNVTAKVFALRGTFGILQSFAMRKRFGLVAEDELANDLVAAINVEIGGSIIMQMRANAGGSAPGFNAAQPAGVGLFEHFMSYKIQLNKAEAVLVANAGRGTISAIVADKTQCAIIESLDGFQKLTDGNTMGAHVFGTLDGIVVVRVNDTNILGNNQGIVLWKGPSPFEAPVVYTPYMPLMVTGTLQNLTNPLLSTRAAAVWAGIDVLVPNFAVNFDASNF